jgi:hypothetical protein
VFAHFVSVPFGIPFTESKVAHFARGFSSGPHGVMFGTTNTFGQFKALSRREPFPRLSGTSQSTRTCSRLSPTWSIRLCTKRLASGVALMPIQSALSYHAAASVTAFPITVFVSSST